MKILLKYKKVWLFLLPLFITFFLYFFTRSEKLTWINNGNDGGDFLSAILTGGIPHPTGYPTYIVLGRLFQLLPFGDEYFRAVLLSFLPPAFASGLLSLWINKNLTDNNISYQFIYSMAGGLTWGLSPLLWSQAVIIEVHGLQSLFLICTLWLITLNLAKENYKLTLFLSLIFGLGMGNHVTLIFMFPAIVFSIWVRNKNNWNWKKIFLQSGMILLGLLIYLYIPLQAYKFPPINWGNPSSKEGFLWLVTASPYQNLLFGISPIILLRRLLAFASLLRDQFGIIGVIFGVIGLVQFETKQKEIKLSLFWIFCIYLLFSIIYGTDDSTGYLIAAFMVFAIFVAFGIKIIFDQINKPIPACTLIFLIAILMVIKIPNTISKINPKGQYYPAEYAENLMRNLPKNAILITESDPDSFPIWYYHFGLDQRNDISVFVLPLTQFRWYQELQIRTYPGLNYPAVIPSFSNSSVSWGNEFEKLNNEKIICSNKIVRDDENKIVTTCSNGLTLEYILN